MLLFKFSKLFIDRLQKEIKNFEKYKVLNELNERKFIGSLILYSIGLYIIGAIVYYIYLIPTNLTDRMTSLVPFFITPLL